MIIKADAEEMLGTLPLPDLDRYKELIKDDFDAYIFYRRERKGGMMCQCSACGGEFDADINRLRIYDSETEQIYYSKHNDKVNCPKCGRAAVLKCRGRIRNYDRFDQYLNYAFCEPLEDGAVIRCYVAGKEFYEHNIAVDLKFTLESLYILQPGQAYRIFRNWYGGCYYDSTLKDPFLCGTCMGQKYLPYTVVWLDGVLENTFLKYSQLDGYMSFIKNRGYRFSADPQVGIKMIRYLCLYSIYPSIEMFIKLGFGEAVVNFVQFSEPNKRLFNWEADNPIGALRCKNKQEFNELRELAQIKRTNFIYQLKIYRKIKRFEPKITYAECSIYGHLDMKTLNILRDMTLLSGRSLKQITNYLLKQESGQVNTAVLNDFCVCLWRDYIDAASKLGYDLENITVVLPKKLRDAHDRATSAVEYKEKKEKLEIMKKLDKTRRKKYEYSDGEFMIMLPRSLKQIIDEGKALAHCVGGYADRHAQGATTILFLRRCDKPDKPFYTIEIIGNQLVQYHGYANERETNGKKDPDVVEFVQKWHKWVKNGSRKTKPKTKARVCA